MENPIRKAFYLFLITGLLLPSCNGGVDELDDTGSSLSAQETADEEIRPEQPILIEPADVPVNENTSDSAYMDGTYAEIGSYQSPGGPESLGVTLTIKDDVVTAVSIQKNASLDESVNFQTLFEAGITALVLGKPLDEIGTFSSVNGSSLTPVGFQAALDAIKINAAQ